MAGLVLILRATGLLSGLSYLAQSALLHTGLINASAEVEKEDQPFDYNFQIKDLEGKVIAMEQFKGKVIFLNLWATWCGPCRVEMPSIQELYNSVDQENIVFVMLSLDNEEHHGKIVSYVNTKDFTFPVYQPSGYLPRQLQVPSIPTTFIIGKDGKIKSKKVGTANYNTDKFKTFLRQLATAP